jgi:predicted AlkP superfamily phosphohydrolase/phosphomutase
MSDHGASPMHRRFNINRWLQEKGLLTLKSSSMNTRSFVIKHPTVYKLFSRTGLKFVGEILPHPLQQLKIPFVWTQPKPLTERIDWRRTKAYFAPGGGININVKGREPKGIVEPKKEYEELITYLENELYDLCDPKTGEKVVQHILRKEDIFQGPLVHESTDIYILFKEDFHCFPHDGISKKEIFSECPKFLKETKEDLNSSHHTAMIRALKGVLIMKGPAIQCLPINIHEANIMDLTPTILYLLGAPIPEHMDGNLLEKFIRPEILQANPPVKTRLENNGLLKERQKVSYSKEEENLAKEQLKNLGYM